MLLLLYILTCQKLVYNYTCTCKSVIFKKLTICFECYKALSSRLILHNYIKVTFIPDLPILSENIQFPPIHCMNALMIAGRKT